MMTDEATDMQGEAASGVPPRVESCWSCRGPVEAHALFCATCGAVQPPRPADAFARLGLEPSFDIDADDLDRHYFDLQRRLHPDRFAARSAKERVISQSQASELNAAHETLHDPVKRALCLLEMGGVNVHANGCNTVSDPVILMEAMEQREALMEAESAQEVARIAGVAGREMEDCLREISQAFGSRDLAAADRLTTRLKYLTKFQHELRASQAKFAEVA